MRPDEGHAALELCLPHLDQARAQRLLQRRAVDHGRPRGCGRGSHELPRLTRLCGQRVAVLHVGGGRRGGQQGVRLGHERAQRLDELQPRGEQLGAVAGQMGVPDLQRAERVTGAGSGEPRLRLLAAGALPSPWPGLHGAAQQGAALLEHPVVVSPYAGEAGRAGDQQIVEEPAPIGGVALHEREVLGGEQHRAEQAEDVARPGDR